MNQEKILLCVQEHSVTKNLGEILVNSGFSVVVSNPVFSSVTSLASESNPDLIVISASLDYEFAGIKAITELRKKTNVPVMWMSDTPRLCASMIMVLIRRTSVLSDCSMGFSVESASSTWLCSIDSSSSVELACASVGLPSPGKSSSIRVPCRPNRS